MAKVYISDRAFPDGRKLDAVDAIGKGLRKLYADTSEQTLPDRMQRLLDELARSEECATQNS